jgi:hypothetical protein
MGIASNGKTGVEISLNYALPVDVSISIQFGDPPTEGFYETAINEAVDIEAVA